MRLTLLAIASLAASNLISAQNAGVISAAYQRPSAIDVARGQIVTFYVGGAGAALAK